MAPMLKNKDDKGPVPSKTIQLNDFSKGMMRNAARDGIPDEAVWDLVNAQVIGPGDLRTILGPENPTGGGIDAATYGLITSLHGVTANWAGVNSAWLIAITAAGFAFRINPSTGAITQINPGAGVGPDTRVTMWRDTHLLLVSPTKGYASYDGTTFLTYPAYFGGQSVAGSSTVIWLDGPTPPGAIIQGMAITGPGIPAGTTVLAGGGTGAGALTGTGTFQADTVTGYPSILWTGGPTQPTDIKSGYPVLGAGIPAGAVIVGVSAPYLPFPATFNAVLGSAGSTKVAWNAGPTDITALGATLRVVGPGGGPVPAGTTIVSIAGPTIRPNAAFLINVTAGSPIATYVGPGPTAGAITDPSQLAPGILISNPGVLPPGTVIDSLSGATLTLSANALVTATSTQTVVYPTLTLSQALTGVFGGFLTTGPTVYIQQGNTAGFINCTASGATTLTLTPALTINQNATTGGTTPSPPGAGTFTIGAGAPKGTDLDPNGKGPRDIAAFEGRAWLVSGERGLLFTGPASFTTFETVYAGGTTTMPDSVFPGRIVTIHAAVQLLWIFGAGAINTISNVQVIVSGTTSFTSFQNENLVAGTGTGLADSVQSLFRTMIFAQPTGVYAILGATPQKLSDPLDGLMPFVRSVGTGPAAVFMLNDILCYGVLVDLPYTTAPLVTPARRGLLVYSRPTWFVARQGDTLTYICSLLRSDGTIQCWGTDGTHVFQLFNGPTSNWDISLKQFDFGMFTRRDTMRRIAVSAEIAPIQPGSPYTANLNVWVENGTLAVPAIQPSVDSTLTWINNSQVLTPWVNATDGPVTWGASGDLVFLSETKISGNVLSAHLFGRDSLPMIIGSVAMEIGLGGEWTFAP